MIVINKLLTNSRTAETNTVGNRIITEYEKNDWSEDAHLTMVFNSLKPVSLDLTKAINRIKAESNLEEKDEERDKVIRSAFYLVNGYLHHPDGTISTAAVNVNRVLDNYGLSITTENFATESAHVESMLQDLAEADLQASVTALPGFTQLVDDIRTAQTAFESAKVIFEEEKAREGTKLSASDLKKQVTSIINNNLIIYLAAMEQVNEEKYGDLARTVAQIIDDNNIIVKKRLNNKGDNPPENEG